MRDGLRNFNKCLILTKEFDGGQQVKHISIKEAYFCVRVYDLPLMARNEFIGHIVGASLGRVENVDLDAREIEWGEFMRVRVCIDIIKSLLRRKRLNIGPKNLVWISFTYERFPDICFCYGVLGHSHHNCTLWATMKEKCKRDGFP